MKIQSKVLFLLDGCVRVGVLIERANIESITGDKTVVKVRYKESDGQNSDHQTSDSEVCELTEWGTSSIAEFVRNAPEMERADRILAEIEAASAKPVPPAPPVASVIDENAPF